MEEVKPATVESKKKKREATMKALDPEVAKALTALREKANRKNFGRPIRDSEIIEVALPYVTGEDLRRLQMRTIRDKDRVKAAFSTYQKKRGKLPMERFLSLLIAGEINPAELRQEPNQLETK